MTHVVPALEIPQRGRRRLISALDSLSGRMMLASLLLAVLIAGVFVLLAFTVSDLSESASRETRAKDVVTDTVVLQRLVLDLETGLRGFALTGDKSFLVPWRAARRQMPEALGTFLREASQDPRRRAAARRLAGRITSYINEYSIPLVRIAQDDPKAATSADAFGEDQIRFNKIRKGLDDIVAVERTQAADTAASAHREARRAIGIGLGGIAASVWLILLVGVYLTRSIARPVRDVALEAKRVARGDLTVHLDERGPGEVGSLKRAFRAMAADLAERQQALEDQNARLRESERLKSELVSIVSHEIRTPLASILGFTSVLLEREISPPDRKRFLEIIAAEAHRLTSLLDEFLDVQRLEDGPLELTFREVDLSSLMRMQVALYSAESDRHWLELHLPEEPLIVEGDPSRLTQVLSNLISNAIKYSPDGGAVEVTGEERDGVVHIQVRDEGFGIPDEVRDRIFTKFFRGSAAEHGIAGSGLGLALARTVVEAHGGSISFESAGGDGTTFSVLLPKPGADTVIAVGERRHEGV